MLQALESAASGKRMIKNNSKTDWNYEGIWSHRIPVRPFFKLATHVEILFASFVALCAPLRVFPWPLGVWRGMPHARPPAGPSQPLSSGASSWPCNNTVPRDVGSSQSYGKRQKEMETTWNNTQPCGKHTAHTSPIISRLQWSFRGVLLSQLCLSV